MFLQMMDTTHWIWASLIVLSALALSAVCIHFRRGAGTSLCCDCRYNDARLCERTERPRANVCTAYRPGPVEIAEIAEIAEKIKETPIEKSVPETH
jgi:hypothetical protein